MREVDRSSSNAAIAGAILSRRSTLNLIVTAAGIERTGITAEERDVGHANCVGNRTGLKPGRNFAEPVRRSAPDYDKCYRDLRISNARANIDVLLCNFEPVKRERSALIAPT